MPTIDDDIRAAARAHVSVLITAESHEERDLYARLIHARSGSDKGNFVAFSGHGFTSPGETPPEPPRDAVTAAFALASQFDQARGGTLFIDDLSRLTDSEQRLLLSLLDNHRASTIVRGRDTVRCIAGASHHMDRERATGAFCDSLFYRLNIVHIDLIRH